MICKHKKSKLKLVAHAADSRLGHTQKFIKKRCCSDCGIVLKEG